MRNSFEYECSATELLALLCRRGGFDHIVADSYGGACEDAVQIEVASRRDSRPENSNLKIDFRILNFSKKTGREDLLLLPEDQVSFEPEREGINISMEGEFAQAMARITGHMKNSIPDM